MPGKMAKAIRARRAAKGWTQEELAKRLKVDQSYVTLLEQGKRTPSLATLRRLAKALGVPLTELLG